MNENRRKKVVYGALVLAIIYGAYNFWPESRTDEPTVSQASVQSGAAGVVAAAISTPLIDTTAIESAPWGQDPFRVQKPPAGAPKIAPSSAPGWRLSGILFNQTYPLAIIDGKSVGVGDQIKGATVISIDRKRVTLDHRGKQYTLTVSKG
jgi:hypothetical protein